VKDRHSASGDEAPDAFGPEYWAHFLDDLDEDDFGGERPHLITVDELRAAGALDVPAGWRKSLGEERPYLLPGFEDDDEGADSNGEGAATNRPK
jgi:hypothetical protein